MAPTAPPPREAPILIVVSLNRSAGRMSLVMIFALAVAALVAFSAGQASASNVSCGDTITAEGIRLGVGPPVSVGGDHNQRPPKSGQRQR
jgi:hypothetical protein